jgi:hypothetical protein
MFRKVSPERAAILDSVLLGAQSELGRIRLLGEWPCVAAKPQLALGGIDPAFLGWMGLYPAPPEVFPSLNSDCCRRRK